MSTQQSLLSWEEQCVSKHPVRLEDVLSWEGNVTSWHLFPKELLVVVLEEKPSLVSLPALCWNYVQVYREAIYERMVDLGRRPTLFHADIADLAQTDALLDQLQQRFHQERRKELTP